MKTKTKTNFTSDLGNCFTYYYKGQKFYKLVIDGVTFHSLQNRTECFQVFLKVCGKIPTEIISYSRYGEDKVNAKVLVQGSNNNLTTYYFQMKNDMWREDNFVLNGKVFENYTNYSCDGKTI